MYKGKKILGTMVVDLESARCYGRVRNMILDLEEQRIVGLILPGKTWLHPPAWLDFTFVQDLGPDAVSVVKWGKTVSTKEIKNFKGYLKKGIRNFWGLTVISREGKLAGYVEDLWVGIPGGRIEGIQLSHGFLGDVLSGREFLSGEQIVSMSLECIVVEGSR